MKYMPLEKIKPGMALAQSLESPDGLMTLGQGAVLNENLLEKIKSWGLNGIEVAEQESAGFNEDELESLLASVLESPVETEEPVQREETPKEKFEKVCSAVEKELQQIFITARYLDNVPIDRFKILAQQLYNLLHQPGSFLYLHAPARSEYYLYRHAIDAALVAGLAGRWFKLDEFTVKSLVFAGLVHDIGKAKVFFEILSKPGTLNQEELAQAKLHVTKSYEMLAETGQVPQEITLGVYEHHERADGSGYPRQLAINQISLFGKILALSDVYDALISDRYYRQGITPFAAAKLIVEEMGTMFDPALLRCFFEKMQQSLLGTSVELNTGEQGEVIYFQAYPSLQPLLRLTDGRVVDLNVNQTLQIVKLNIR